jgi:phytanoyl-CoA hydroxylase
MKFLGTQDPSDFAKARFHRDGYFIVPGLVSEKAISHLNALIDMALKPLLGPAEFEADVGYPGAPADRSAKGGETPRRLLHAYARHQAFRDWAGNDVVVATLRVLLDSEKIMLAQSHHNCIMTKFPGYSSRTNWHQDSRYWSYDRPEQITVWLALGDEVAENGALQLIPGSHYQDIERGRLDGDLFLRTELHENQELIDQAVVANLKAGDVLFFHSRCFHAAGKNTTNAVKKSLVFTYHTQDNQPIPGTKSSQYPSVCVSG